MRATAIILLALLSGAPAARAQTDADRQFTFAVRLLRDGQSDLAADALNDFLRDYAADQRVSDAHYYLALLARQAREPRQAMAHLAKVTRPVFVDEAGVRLLRGQLNLEAGQVKQAKADLDAIDPDALRDNESRAVWHYLRGVADRQSGDNASAAKQFALAGEAESSVRGRAMLELGKARLALRQYPQALEALTDVPETDASPADRAEARLLAGGVAFELKQYEQAAALYQTVLDQHPRGAEAGAAATGLLRALLAAGRNEQVVARHDALADSLPADDVGEGWYLRAAALVRLKRYDEAIKALEQFGRRTGNDHPLSERATYLAGLCLYHTDPAKYEAWYAANRPDSRQLAYLRAAAAIQRERFTDAIGYLAPLIDPPGAEYAGRALLERANLYEKTGQPQRAADDYALFASRYGKDAQASDATRRAIDLAFEAGQHAQVVERATAWLAAAPAAEKPAVQLKLAASLIALKQNDRAAAVLDALIAAGPDPRLAALAQYYRGLLLAGRPGRTDDAVAALTEALGGALPEAQQTESLALLARLYRLAGEDDKAIAAYEQLRKRAAADTFDPLTAMWVGRGLYETGRYEAALPWLEVALAHGEAPEAARAEAMYYAARAQQALQRWPEAAQAYRELLGRTSAFGERGRLGLAQSLVGSGDVEAAMEEYNGLINVRTTAVAAAALYDSALLHRDTADQLAAAGYADAADAQLKEARRRLSRLLILYDVKELGDLPTRARLALGRIEARIGQVDLARRRFEEVAGRPGWSAVGRAEAALLNEQRAEAIRLLRSAAEADDADPVVAADARRRLNEIR